MRRIRIVSESKEKSKLDELNFPLSHSKNSLKEGLAIFRSGYLSMRAPALPPRERRENTFTLGTMARELLEKGADVETLALTADVHPLTVKSWLKAIQINPLRDRVDQEQERPQTLPQKKKAPAPFTDLATTDQKTSAEVITSKEKSPAVEAFTALPPGADPIATSYTEGSGEFESLTPNLEDGDWIRIRIGGRSLK